MLSQNSENNQIMQNTQNPFEEALTNGYYGKSNEHDSTKTLKIENPIQVHSYVESFIDVISYILLAIGGLSLIVFTILATRNEWGELFDDFNWAMFAIGIGIALTQTVFFAILQVLRNISIKLNK